MTLRDSVATFVDDRISYYRQWMFDEPLVVSEAHSEDLARIQRCMYRLIRAFVADYDRWAHIMPLSADARRVIEAAARKSYRVGTYRTDFVYDASWTPRLIEITCRMSLNGIFTAAVMKRHSDDFRAAHLKGEPDLSPYEDLYAHLEQLLRGKDGIILLKGVEERNESKIFIPIFERAGIPVTIVAPADIEAHLDKMASSLVLSELSHAEIFAIPPPVMERLARVDLLNDLRTILLVHDKRFFSVLNQRSFRESVLSKEDAAFFERFLVPTFAAHERPDLWNEALEHREKWILKHRVLGKSVEVHAGPVTSEADWRALFAPGKREDYILQEWIPQTRLSGHVGGTAHEDFHAGTLLFFDDHYFGLGEFRLSSFPVSNKGDHRKMSSIVVPRIDGDVRAAVRNCIG